MDALLLNRCLCGHGRGAHNAGASVLLVGECVAAVPLPVPLGTAVVVEGASEGLACAQAHLVSDHASSDGHTASCAHLCVRGQYCLPAASDCCKAHVAAHMPWRQYG